ncbi:MAG: hypothetical protein FWB85_08370 [Chitinispirillia bacterium]|nr:hypothetical protein [Chitinispirillia bacterium]MCL2241741.1 hypothetical protein [Chitinispirillia bacterium]
MGRFTKRVVAGLTAALMMAGGAFAQQFILDDLEDGDNANKVSQYWYYYVGDDLDELLGMVTTNPTAVITNAGPGDEYGAMSFIAQTSAKYSGSQAPGTARGSYVAAMEFVDFADLVTKESVTYPVIGMGTILSSNDDKGFGASFANVDEIQFDMWAPEDAVVYFKVETTENSPTGIYGPAPPYGTSTHGCVPAASGEADKPKNKGCNPANAYYLGITASGAWETHKVKIKPVVNYNGVTIGSTVPGSPTSSQVMGSAGDLKQDGWWGKAFNFNPANATKLAWQINGDKNATLKGGTLLIDNIKFVGSGINNDFYIPADECRTCAGKTLPTPHQLISDFDDYDESPRKNKFGWYWYNYDDNEAGGSAIITGLTEDPYGKRDPVTGEFMPGMVMDVAGKGVEGSNAAHIDFEINDAMFDETGTGLRISSFVGIGTNFYDDLADTKLYQSMGSHTGIFFRFKASAAVDFITVEFNDNQNVERIEQHGTDGGQVWYAKIPVANTNWNTAVVSLSDLSLPLWIKEGDWRYGKPFDKSKLAKIQFKYAGSGEGSLTIDDVYFVGGNTEAGIRHAVSSKAKAAGIRASYGRGGVNVNWNAAAPIASGKISLINTKGRVVASSSVAKTAGSNISVNLGKGVLPSGMYFVRVDARDVNGKRIVQQAPVTVVR